MTVEFICVGTELLMGNIVNTNAAFMSRRCAMLGLDNYYQTVVGDNAERLESVLKTAKERSDIVILSGGLGPTEDDLTKETAAKVMGKTLIEDEKAWKHIKKYFEKRNLELTDNNRKQALVPEGSVVLYNRNGTAPGIIIEGDCRMILLPGPPMELEAMWEEYVDEYLRKLNPAMLLSEMVKICGAGESKVETELKDLIDAQTNPTIATYAKNGEVDVRVTAKGADEKECKKLLKPVVKEIKKRFGEKIFTTDENVSLEMAVIQILNENKMTLTTAESMTGGMLASRFISVPGASEVIKQGFITYSNKAKRKYLGVKRSTLDKDGAVSEQCAKEMAKGGAAAAKSDVCVSVTGIAGPAGDSHTSKVGLTYIGVCVAGKVKVKEYVFDGSREKIRQSASAAALTFLRHCLLENLTEKTFGEENK